MSVNQIIYNVLKPKLNIPPTLLSLSSFPEMLMATLASLDLKGSVTEEQAEVKETVNHCKENTLLLQILQKYLVGPKTTP